MRLGILFAIAAGASVAAFGQTTDLDPLHGYCSVGCADNGNESPTTQDPITGFGFTISPGPNSGDLLIDILVPNNEEVYTSYAITGSDSSGSVSATATKVSATDWTSGGLDSYLGLSASPANPFGAFSDGLAYSNAYTFPYNTGFSVYQVDLGTVTLEGASDPSVSPLLDTTALPTGTYIVGFLNIGTTASPQWIATANSGAILEIDGGGSGAGTGGPLPHIPEPSSVVLLGTISLFVLTGAKKALNRR